MSKTIISNAVFLLCMLFCFIFTLVSYIKFSTSDYMYVASIGRNWKNGPISDVEAGGYDCQVGKDSAIDDRWDGTVSGCICPALITDGLTRSSCSRKSFACQTIYQIGPMPYRLWKGTNICVKRGPNYLDLKTAKTPSECGSGYKSCGVVDTLNQVLCYPSNVECPYNNVKALSSSQQVPNDMKYTVVPMGFNGQDGKFIFSNENVKGKTITQFKIDDDTPCMSPDYRHLLVKPYYLEVTWDKNSCQNDVGGQFVDSAYTKLDSESYSRLYSDNQITGILQSLPQFNKYYYLQSQTNIYYKNYIGMDRKCLGRLIGNSSSAQILNDLVNIEKLVSSASTCALVGIIFAGIGLLIAGIFGCIMCSSGGAETGIVFYVINGIFFSIPALIISAILVSKSGITNYDMSTFSDSSCTDVVTSAAVIEFVSKINSGATMAVVYLIFSIFAFILNIAGFFYSN